MTLAFPYAALTNQWLDGEEINAAKMFQRVDTNFNLLRNAVLNPPRFKGSIVLATAITATTFVPYPVIYDTAAGWDATNHWYVVSVAGTYQVFAAGKWGTAPGSTTNITILKDGAAVIVSPDAANVNFTGPQIACSIQAVVGTKLGVDFNHGFTTQPDGADNNYFILTWVGV